MRDDAFVRWGWVAWRWSRLFDASSLQMAGASAAMCQPRLQSTFVLKMDDGICYLTWQVRRYPLRLTSSFSFG